MPQKDSLLLPADHVERDAVLTKLNKEQKKRFEDIRAGYPPKIDSANPAGTTIATQTVPKFLENPNKDVGENGPLPMSDPLSKQVVKKPPTPVQHTTHDPPQDVLIPGVDTD